MESKYAPQIKTEHLKKTKHLKMNFFNSFVLV